MKILNLTQHAPTAEQIAAGVYDAEDRANIIACLTFETLPSREELEACAEELAHIAADIEGARYAMIGGAPFFMAHLERALKYRGVTPLYAFSRREVVEETRDGATVKTAVFRHLGFVEA